MRLDGEEHGQTQSFDGLDGRLRGLPHVAVDMDERLVQVLELAGLRASPITDLKEPDETSVDVGVLEGGINNTANEQVAHRMRERCGILVALGDCAVFGGVPAMRNFYPIKEVLRRAYVEMESTDSEGKIPTDPELCTPTPVRAVHKVVPVDVFVPGCPSPRPASLLRELMHMGQVIQSHGMHFFELGGPDLLLGFDADPAGRNVVGLIQANPALTLKAVSLRKFGQEIIRTLGGRRVHPNLLCRVA